MAEVNFKIDWDRLLWDMKREDNRRAAEERADERAERIAKRFEKDVDSD
jgi:hypothetical protein